MNAYEIDETTNYKGINYTILDTLDHAMLLVVKTEDLTSKEFPVKTLVIPNELHY